MDWVPGTARRAVRVDAGGRGETDGEARTNRVRDFGKPAAPVRGPTGTRLWFIRCNAGGRPAFPHPLERRTPRQALPRPNADSHLPPRPGPRDQASENLGDLAPVHMEVPAPLTVAD